MKKLLSLLLAVSLVVSLFAACGEEETPRKRRSRDDEDEIPVPTEFSTDDLLGSWSVKTEQFEATLVFREEDEVFEATWTVFNFGEEVWGEETFQIKEASGFTMVGLMPDGQIKYFTFAPFGQTLYFDGMYYTNPEKNLGLPEDTAKFAFIRDGLQTTAMHHVFLGMTYDEVKRAYPSVRELEDGYGKFSYDATTYDVEADVPDHSSSWAYFRFDENQQLVQTYLHLFRSTYPASSYRTLKTVAERWLAELTEAYGEYTMTERTYTGYNEEEQHIYNTYRWELGNVICELELDGIDTIDNLDAATLTYTLKGYE